MPTHFFFFKGHYVYAAVKNKTGYLANSQFVSPRYYKSGHNCKFTFWYHMNGTSYGLLYLKFRRNAKDNILWFGRFMNLDQWRNASVDIPQCATDFQVPTPLMVL